MPSADEPVLFEPWYDSPALGGEIRDVSIEEDESLVILTDRAPYLYRGHVEGGVSPWSEESGGEALKNPWSLVRAGGKLFVWDVALKQLSLLTTDSATERSERQSIQATWGIIRGDVRDVTHSPVLVARGLGKGVLVQTTPRGVTMPVDAAMSDLVMFNLVGESIGPALSIGNDPEAMYARTGRALFLTPAPVWATCGDAEVVVHNPLHPTLKWFGADLLPVAEVRVPWGPRAVELEDKRAYLSWRLLREGLGGGATAEAPRRDAALLKRAMARFGQSFPAEAPLVMGLLCDEGGRAWAQMFSTKHDPLGRSREWAIIDKGGEILRTVVFPAGFHAIEVRGALIGGVTVGPNGAHRATVWRLPAGPE